ncbi:MAG: hypothetical protein QXR58_01660 [Candidatus Micrarchaeaceae archaeon]
MAQMVVSKQLKKDSVLVERELVLLAEIGKDEIISASSFVEYISEEYAMPKSTVWYTLKKLKEKELLDFANKDEVGKPLQLTRRGLRKFMSTGIKTARAEFAVKEENSTTNPNAYAVSNKYDYANYAKTQYRRRAIALSLG